MRVNVRFINPFGKQEEKFCLFNVKFYNCRNSQYQYHELTIDIINFSFQFIWPRNFATAEF